MRVADREVDVEGVLEALGIESAGQRGDWADCLCPIHPENNPSFSVNLDHGSWVCRHEHLTGGLLDMVVSVRGCSRGEAIEWVVKLTPLSDVSVDRLIAQLVLAPEPGADKQELVNWTQRYMSLPTDELPEYWFKRGFTWETAARFGVRYDDGNGGVAPASLIWPVKNENANTLSYVQRRVSPGPWTKKYFYPKGFKVTLFPLDHFTGDEVILVEGPIDALWLHQWGWTGALAMMSSGITRGQVAWLRARVRKIILALDNDTAGVLARQTLLRQLGGLDVRVALVPDPFKDVQELDPETLARVITSARSAVGIILS